MSERLLFEMPWPPSVNKCYRTFRGKMLLSRAGISYKKEIAILSKSWNFKPFKDNRLAITITAHPKDRRRRDLDNLLKITLDSLQAIGLFNDDEQFDAIFIERIYDVNYKGVLLVQIYVCE